MRPFTIAAALAASLAAIGLAGCQTVEEDGYSYSNGGYYGPTVYGTTVYEQDVVVGRPRYDYGYRYDRRWDRDRPDDGYGRPPRRDGPPPAPRPDRRPPPQADRGTPPAPVYHRPPNGAPPQDGSPTPDGRRWTRPD